MEKSNSKTEKPITYKKSFSRKVTMKIVSEVKHRKDMKTLV